MKLFLKRIIVLLMALSLSAFISQAEAQTRKVRSAQKKAERNEIQQKRKQKRADKAFIKHHISIQTKEVQKRMKKNRRESDKKNKPDKEGEPFIDRLFKKKKQKG